MLIQPPVNVFVYNKARPDEQAIQLPISGLQVEQNEGPDGEFFANLTDLLPRAFVMNSPMTGESCS